VDNVLSYVEDRKNHVASENRSETLHRLSRSDGGVIYRPEPARRLSRAHPGTRGTHLRKKSAALEEFLWAEDLDPHMIANVPQGPVSSDDHVGLESDGAFDELVFPRVGRDD
jgi:hypothetical protein